MKIFRIFISAILMILLGCSPIPISYECDLPDFSSVSNIEILDAYDTSGIFEAYCPVAAPKHFRVKVNSSVVEIDTLMSPGNRIYLRALSENGDFLNIEGNDILKMPNGQEFTHHMPLNGQSIKISIEGNNVDEILELQYSKLKCTCMEYDSL